MSQHSILSTQRFSLEDQTRFARLSGDWNAMHLDPVAARRTLAGAPVVHGIHLLTWALECVSQSLKSAKRCSGIRVRFQKWAYLDRPVVLTGSFQESSQVRVQLEVDGAIAMTAVLDLEPSVSPPDRVWSAEGSTPEEAEVPLQLGIVDMRDRSGVLSLPPTGPIVQAYPGVTQFLGISQTTALICTSKLVGMICPGAHSIYAGLDLRFSQDIQRDEALNYAVEDVDERFNAVKLTVRGGGVAGRVDSFVRQPPKQQASISEISRAVRAGEFASTKALVVGGSRGLGEFCAKAIAAGGGDVTISYALGRADAERVAEEIVTFGGRCEILKYDVRADPEPQLALAPWSPSSILYFATPKIVASGKALNSRLLADFMQYYVVGFSELLRVHQALFHVPVRVFYPSSIYVEQSENFLEYGLAKAAGENLCRQLSLRFAEVKALVFRLPRLPTDQTVTLTNEESVSVDSVVLPILREFLLSDGPS